MDRPPHRIPATRNLATTDECNVSFEIPAVLSERLDTLVKLLESEGEDGEGNTVTQRTTSRKELISALILRAPAETEELEALLDVYRKARAGDARVPPIARGQMKIASRSPGLRLTTDQELARKRGAKRPPRRNRSSALGGERH